MLMIKDVVLSFEKITTYVSFTSEKIRILLKRKQDNIVVQDAF